MVRANRSAGKSTTHAKRGSAQKRTMEAGTSVGRTSTRTAGKSTTASRRANSTECCGK